MGATPEEKQFSADDLPPEQVEALKELERRNRDKGAFGRRTKDWLSDRGEFLLRAEAMTFLRYIDPKPHQTVLDAGAGMGRIAVLVAPKVARLVAADFSATALEVLATEARERGLKNVETIASDLCGIPETAGPFDTIYSIEVLQHIPSHKERLASMQSLYRLLKPGGNCMVCVVAWNERIKRQGRDKEGFWGSGDGRLYAYCFTPQELKELYEEAGFRDVQIRGVDALPGRLIRHLPASCAVLESWTSCFPALAGISWYVMGTATK